MSVYVCGDLHGKHDLDKIRSKKWKEQKDLTKDDVLIQLGDFGWIWHPIGTNRDQEYWCNYLATRNYTLLVVLGNHENYDEIKTLPECEMFSGTVQYYETTERFGTGRIYFAKRGEIYTIGGKKFWAFGGALSNDKDARTPGVSWWEGELPTWDEYEHGMSMLDKHDWKVDFVVTHTLPMNIIGDVIHRTIYTQGKFSDPVAKYLFEIQKKLEFEGWFAGHFHTDVKVDNCKDRSGYFQVCYNKLPLQII